MSGLQFGLNVKKKGPALGQRRPAAGRPLGGRSAFGDRSSDDETNFDENNDNNTASADGAGSVAYAAASVRDSEGNTATATNGGFAAAGVTGLDLDGNTATADGAGATALAGYIGENNASRYCTAGWNVSNDGFAGPELLRHVCRLPQAV